MPKPSTPKSRKQVTPAKATAAVQEAISPVTASDTDNAATTPDTGVQEHAITSTTSVSSDDGATDTITAPALPSDVANEDASVADVDAMSTVPVDADLVSVDVGNAPTLEHATVSIPEVETPDPVEAVKAEATVLETHHSVMPAHPAADLFPLLPDDQLQELADDIRVRGLIEPVVTIEVGGIVMILDGRNRARACVIAGVEPRMVAWDGSGGSPSGFVLSKNIHRRHLTPAQRAAIAVDLLPMLEVEARERQVAAALTTNARFAGVEQAAMATAPEAGAVKGRSRDLAASALGVSGRSVQEAKTISEQAPEVLAEVRSGSLSLPEGRRIAALPSPAQRKDAIKKVKSEKGTVKKREPKPTVAKPVDAIDAVRAAVGEVGRLLDEVPKEKRPIWWTALRNAIRKVAR